MAGAGAGGAKGPAVGLMGAGTQSRGVGAASDWQPCHLLPAFLPPVKRGEKC